jgi:hypothetical protein
MSSVVAVLAAALLLPVAAQPVYTVDTLGDAPDAAIDGVCDTGGGVCSLRAAIMESNHRPDAGTVEATIVLSLAGTYLLTLPIGVPDDETNGDLNVSGRVRIQGKGWDVTILDANHVDRLLDIPAGSVVTLADLRVQGGRPNRDGTDDGGGIRNGGTLTLLRCLVRDNQPPNLGFGGGIFSAQGSTLTVTDSVLRVNNGAGGAILSEGDTRLQRCTVNSNASWSYGGAIYQYHGSLKVLNSTFQGNNASIFGGAVDLYGASAGFWNVSIFGNACPSSGCGGGVRAEGGTTLTISSSVIFGNESVSHDDVGDCGDSTVVSNGYNLVYDMSTCAIAGATSSAFPNLMPLANNGGLTLTSMPGPSSAAIDAGPPAGCLDDLAAPLTVDQRGVKRPIGAKCDLGAVEVEPKGDANGDGSVNVNDIFYLINFLFAGGPAPKGRANVNGDSAVSVQDVFYLINFLFAGGAAPI